MNPEDLSISNLSSSEVMPSTARPTPLPMTARDPGSYFISDHDGGKKAPRLHWTLKLAEKIRHENE